MEERKRFLDEVEDQEEESKDQVETKHLLSPQWVLWLNVAAALAAITLIFILTLEMALGLIIVGKLAAYAFGACLLIGVLFLLVIGYRFALSKIQPGLWRYTFWFISIPVAFVYYLIFTFLIFGQFAPLLVRIMELVFSNAP